MIHTCTNIHSGLSTFIITGIHWIQINHSMWAIKNVSSFICLPYWKVILRTTTTKKIRIFISLLYFFSLQGSFSVCISPFSTWLLNETLCLQAGIIIVLLADNLMNSLFLFMFSFFRTLCLIIHIRNNLRILGFCSKMVLNLCFLLLFLLTSRFISLYCHIFSQMSHDMWFPTMWHFDIHRLGRACAASF